MSSIGEPDLITQDKRGFTARWLGVCDLEPEYGLERKANVVLHVSHVARRGGAGAYTANLMNEAEDTEGIRSVTFDFGSNAAVDLVRQPAARMSHTKLREVLADAILTTQRRYADGDERVRALWKGVGC